MTIETKYNIGDKVRYRPLNPWDSSVRTGKIYNIHVTAFDNGAVIRYMIDGDYVYEDNIFDITTK